MPTLQFVPVAKACNKIPNGKNSFLCYAIHLAHLVVPVLFLQTKPKPRTGIHLTQYTMYTVHKSMRLKMNDVFPDPD
jgi:hypothetical protein